MDKDLSSQSYGLSSSHIWIRELDYKESWAPKNRCYWTEVLEKTLESPLDCKEIKSVNPKGDQSWIFIVRTDVEAETAILWPPDAKSQLTGKDPVAGKDWRQEEIEGDDRVWDVWMTSSTWWTWVWASSRSWWWTEKHGVVQSMGSQKSDTAKWLNWTEGTRGDIVRWRWWSNPRSIRTFDAIYLLWFLLSCS